MSRLPVIALLMATSLSATEIDLPLEKCPEKIQATARRLAAGGEITHMSNETEKDGRLIYEVAYRVGDKKFEAEISAQGEVLVVDQEISLAQAPEPVARVIKEKTAGGKIVKIEKATKGKEVFYEAEFVRGGHEHEVRVAIDGRVLKEE